MSKSKRGGGADSLYTAFGWNPYKYNPSVAREQQIGLMLSRAISELAMNRFKWSGLPESIDPRFLELMLFYNGLAIYYFDKRYDKELVVRGSGTGYVNVFDNPVSFTVIAPGQQFEVSGEKTNVMANVIIPAYDRIRHSNISPERKKEKAIPIWANYLRYPDWDKVQVYARRLATMDRSIEINSSNARRSRILRGTPQTQLSVANIVRSIDQGDEVPMVTGPLEDLQFIDTIDFGVTPDSYEKLHILRTRTWNECMGLLGINNANQDKKERLVAAEVSANDEQTDSMRFVALNARRQACELISEVFGHKVTVEYNTEVEAQAKAAQAMTQAQTTQGNSDNGADETPNADEKPNADKGDE